MTTPINTLEDILNALERDPALREALRRHILTEELLQMPVRLERIEADVSTLKDNLTTLTTTVNRIGGDVSMLKGSDYESHVARLANRFLRRQLGVAATVFSAPNATKRPSQPSWTTPRSTGQPSTPTRPTSSTRQTSY